MGADRGREDGDRLDRTRPHQGQRLVRAIDRLPPLPPGATTLTLSWDWNFFSEEFIEYCGSEFQDSFEVTLGLTSLQSDQIDDLCPIVVPDPIAFDRGDVHTTGWKTQTVDVTAFAGTSGNLLKFAAKDVGDSVYDSAILVDNVRLVAE